MSDVKYFIVPISLLRGLISAEKGIKEFVQEVVKYSLYYHAIHSPYGEEGEYGGYNTIETQIKAAAYFLNVKIGGINNTIEKGKLLYDKFYEKDVFCMINTEVLWKYHNEIKTAYQIALFCGFCATRSIIGDSQCKKTNKGMIIARMFGYKNQAELIANTPKVTAKNISKKEIEQRKEEIEQRNKYATRYHFDKIMLDLECDWGLKRYSDHIRGMFISYSLGFNELAKINEKSKKTNKLNDLKEAKRQARENAKITAP